jgi:CBS domain-containing protein
MRVHEVMTPRVQAVAPRASLSEAAALMREHRIHHLLVLEGRSMVGVLSSRDLLGRSEGDVASAMSVKVVSVAPNTTVRQAANLLRGRTLGCVPVLDGGRPVGMLTVSDLLELVGRGADRGVGESTRWTLRGRGPRRRAGAPRPESLGEKPRGRTRRTPAARGY